MGKIPIRRFSDFEGGNMNTNLFQARYYFEHTLLPELLYSEKGRAMVVAILKEKQKLLVDLMNDLIKGQGFICPYTEKDYAILPQLVSAHGNLPEIAVLEIRMPKPEGTPLCSRVFICHDKNFENIRYYTVELSFDNSYVLCGWDKGQIHLNHGSAPETEKELFYKVYKLYSDHLSRKV